MHFSGLKKTASARTRGTQVRVRSAVFLDHKSAVIFLENKGTHGLFGFEYSLKIK